MKKILAFGASNSSRSINQKLATWAASQVANSAPTILDLNDFEMPIFSIDRERENGVPEAAKRFKSLVESHDGILISFAEHNGAYAAAFKNIFDWASRLEGSVWADKPMFLMATSPGGRGGASVLGIALQRFPFNGGSIAAAFSLPFFKTNFSEENGVLDEELLNQFLEQVAKFEKELHG